MKFKSSLLSLSILVLIFTGCSSSQRISEEEARLAAEHERISEQARIAAEQAEAARQALAAAEQAKTVAEQALAAAKKANSAEATRAAAEAKAKADAEHARVEAEAQAAAERARVEEEARMAAEQARAAARQSKADARQTRAQTITLAAGTPIKIITSSELSTKTANTGDGFTAILNEDISEGGRVVARRGATVKGVITDSDPGGRVKDVATISLTLSNLALASGEEISVKTNDHHVEANSSVGKDVAKTGIGAGIGAAIGAIAGGGKGAAIGAGIGGTAGAVSALVTHGDPAVIAPETQITFNLSAPLTVVMK